MGYTQCYDNYMYINIPSGMIRIIHGRKGDRKNERPRALLEKNCANFALAMLCFYLLSDVRQLNIVIFDRKSAYYCAFFLSV
jgi:hypothetical protein